MWLSDWFISMCRDVLHNNVREQLVGVSDMELGGPLVLKLMLDNMMDVDNSNLCFLIQIFQTIWMEDVP